MKNKVALVTGSGKERIGRVIAEHLAEQGYAIAVHYRTSQVEADQAVVKLRKLGVQAAAFQADLTREAEVEAMVNAVFVEFGRVDVLVNAAAIWPRKELEQVAAEDVLKCFEANTLSSFLVSRSVGLRMIAQSEGGCVILIGDWADARPYLGYAAYFPSKAAIPGLTRTLAVELGTRNPNVRVNAILPGPVMLPPDLPAEERDEAIQATLVKREGTPRHIALAVCSLVLNDFITGVCLPVDGGRSIYAGGS